MSDNLSNNKRIAKNTVFLTIRMVFVLVVTLYTSRVFLNVLGVEDYGIMNVVAGFVSMFAFIKASLSNATQRFYNYEMGANGEQAVSDVYTTSIIIQLVIGIIVVILLETVGLWYLYHKMVIPPERFHIAFWLFQFSTISSFITVMQIPFFAAVMAYEKMNFYAILSILEAFLKLGFAFIIPFVSIDKLLSFGCFTLSITVLTFLLNLFYCKKNFPLLHWKKSHRKDLYPQMLSFTGWNAFGSFSISFREQGLNMILNIFYGPAMNAARGIAHQVIGAINGLVQTLSVAAQPQLMRSYAQGNQGRSMQLMYSISKLGYMLMFMMILPVALEVHYILSMWLGKAVPEYTGAFIRVILLTSLLNTLTAQISTMVHASGKMRKYQVITSLFCLLVLPFSYLYLKHDSNPVIVFVIMFVIIAVNYIISLLILRSIVPFSIKDYTRQVMLPLLLSSLISVIIPLMVHHLMSSGFMRLLIVTIVSVSSVSIVFYLLALSVEEKAIFKRIIKRK